MVFETAHITIIVVDNFFTEKKSNALLSTAITCFHRATPVRGPTRGITLGVKRTHDCNASGAEDAIIRSKVVLEHFVSVLVTVAPGLPQGAAGFLGLRGGREGVMLVDAQPCSENSLRFFLIQRSYVFGSDR